MNPEDNLSNEGARRPTWFRVKRIQAGTMCRADHGSYMFVEPMCEYVGKEYLFEPFDNGRVQSWRFDSWNFHEDWLEPI